MAYGSTSVGASAVQITNTVTPLVRGVWIKADGANTNKVYVGTANTVTANSASATDGYQLNAGQEFLVPYAAVSDLSGVWLIAGASSQKVFWFTY